MKREITLFILCVGTLFVNAQSDSIATSTGKVVIHPVQHASMAMYMDNFTVYVDPVGGAALYKDLRRPDFILITDIHGDHMDPKTIDSVKGENTLIIAPKAVAEKLTGIDASKIKVLNNGSESKYHGITIEAIPMYNLPETSDSRHTKGRGNGYVLTIGGKRIYISGDTEDIPEMRKLENIDAAFVCMNLPYTMDINQAANAVLEFEPKIVYPYHFRGQGGLSDVAAFKKIVNDGNAKIEVRQLNWYPSK